MNGKMEVRYAGKIYDVVGTKAMPGGLTAYGIEDEPGHTDWITNVEIVGTGEACYKGKASGKPYPTKPAKFD